MTNTALGAEKEKNTYTITFKSTEHKNFYKEYLSKCRYQDAYHRALVYCIGIDRDTRAHVDSIYDFNLKVVKYALKTSGDGYSQFFQIKSVT